ncbi:phytanoyl-CoA dioxygenase family protein [Variovorax boronicumulans]|uniref:phytanoyl-CoA dioxygenase family protein n=1 Tax=Variovorax boronicumulans TaxID=436515 RepID=UPI003399C318
MSIVNRLLYRIAECDPLYRHVLNRRATREFRAHQAELGDEGRRVLHDLDESGLAFTRIERFPGMADLFEELRERALLVEARRRDVVPAGSDQARTYAFMSNVLGSYPRFDPQSIFARFACQPPILEIVNAYFGMFTQLRKYAVFRNVFSNRSENGNWHRDGVCDAMVMRVFVYFDDVDERNGAMRYARGTHHRSEGGSRERIEGARLDTLSVSCCGPTGTLVFADTRGYHRAGEFTEGERWLYYGMFTSPGFGLDYFRRQEHRAAQRGDPVSWALSSPMTLADNFRAAP